MGTKLQSRATDRERSIADAHDRVGAVALSPWRHRRRVLSRISAGLGIAMVWLMFLSPTGIGGPVGIIWVSGTSMEPGLESGDLVVTYNRDSYEVGDVVAFEIPSGGTVIHRIIDIHDDGTYEFQGDNRAYADPWLLEAAVIQGRSVLEVHKAMTILYWLGRPQSLGAMVFAITVLWWWQQAIDQEVVNEDELDEPEFNPVLI